MSRIFLVFASFLFLNTFLFSQPWFENATDANGNLNFYLIQQNAENYWKNKEIEKGKGFKPYKRWEWYWQNRVYPDGSFPEAGITQKNWDEYLRLKQINSRSGEANWTSLGPVSSTGGYAGIGRINCVAFHPTDINHIWVGAPGGGLWESLDGGNTWTTNFDNSVVLGVSGILISGKNPNIMYIATGDGNASDTYSVGVLKSVDGGLTWQTTGLNWSVSQTRRIRRIIFDPDDENIIFAATSNGLYRTENAGATWVQTVNGNFFDVRANPNPFTNTFYAATGSVIYRSTNNGASFSSVQTISGANRIALGVSNANNDYVYALCSRSSDNGFLGIYRSTNAGSSYTLRASSPNLLGWSSNGSDSGGQGWYDLCITVDPANADIVYTGGVNVWKSTNGGSSWSLRTHWSGASGVQTVHADHHCMEWQNNTTLWLGNDGGIYKSANGGVNWTDKSNGLVISQMYKLGVSQSDNKVITGLQDNGTKLRSNTGNWSDVIGGDGMECAIRPDNATVMYGSLYYGAFRRSTNSGSNWTSIKPSDSGNGAWVTPFEIDPNATQTIYAGFKKVFKSTNQGTNWTAISGDLNSSALNYLHVAPSNSSVIYAGRGSNLYRTDNGGTNWSSRTVPGTNTVMLAIHPSNSDIIWAVRSNYTSGAKVYKSINGGSSWTNISGNLPNLPVNCIIYDQSTFNDALYVGMDVGVFYRDNDMEDWELYSTGLPNAPVTELDIKYDTDEIYASTYGRGLWKSDKKFNSTVCKSVNGVTLENIGIYEAEIQWSPPNPVPANGYEYGYSSTSTPPVSTQYTSDSHAIISGLNSNTTYYFFVRSYCAEGSYSLWQSIGPYYTQATCEDESSDTGGNSANYANNENIVRHICPNIPNHHISITFTDFDVEADWDALYIFNGNSIADPKFSSGNPVTDAGFPAGGYYGTSFPGTFESTHSSGCITLQFMSDQYVTGRGWVAEIECLPDCTNAVLNTNDSGYGSLRHIIFCASHGQNISFSDDLDMDTILLMSPIIINKDLAINIIDMLITLKSDHEKYLFEVLEENTLTLGNIKLIAGNGVEQVRAISNKGTLEMHNVEIVDPLFDSGLGITISNQGNIQLHGNCDVKSE